MRFFFTARTLELASSIFILNVFSLQTQKGSSNCYQYQLQNMWQKCWNQNAAMLQGIRYFSFYIYFEFEFVCEMTLWVYKNCRYRERGPMKSWRPETMAEAIW